MLSPESPGGTTSQVSCEFSTFHPPKVWYPPPAGDRPPKFTLRVITITNTWLLQRLVKQKRLRTLATPVMTESMMEMRKTRINQYDSCGHTETNEKKSEN